MDIIELPSHLLEGSDIDSRWATGPFLKIKLMPPKAKGKRFEEIAENIFKLRKFDVSKAQNTQHDRIVNGSKWEIKGSTVTKGTDDGFSFLQIRPSQDYDFLILETLWFDGRIQFFKIPKSDINLLIERKVFVKQHGGNKAQSGTYSYNGPITPFQEYFMFEYKVIA